LIVEKTAASLFRSAPLLLLVVGLSAGLARPAAADWLVTQEGARVETRGPWQVKGKLVVFTAADGALSSLRLSLVDLDASRMATADRQKMVEEDIQQKPEKKKSVRSITDKDVTHPGTEAAADDAASPKPEDGKAMDGTLVNKGKSSPVVVGSWQKLDRDQKDGIELFGELKNESAEIASQVGLTVKLLDETGAVVATTEAILNANAIEPGSATNFRAIFQGVYTFASAKFEIRSAPLKLQSAEPPAKSKT
jgi:hypothetical protein